jgi:hypothetical protein
MGNLNCCSLHETNTKNDKVVYEESEIFDQTNSIVKLQAFIRGVNYRLRFKIINLNKNLRVLTKKFTMLPAVQDGFLHSKMPGKAINIETVQINKKVSLIEEKLGEFVIEEKELLKCIEEQKHNLRNYSLEYEDGSIYYGYYNKEWEREGLGILMFPDGSKYQGFFKSNKMHGRGRLVGSHGDYYWGNNC